MAGTNLETFYATRLRAGSTAAGSGLNIITSGQFVLGGVAFHGSSTGQVTMFTGVTCSVSIANISFCATTSAVAGGFSPMFMRFPMASSGSGLCVDTGSSADTNITIFWSPMGSNP